MTNKRKKLVRSVSKKTGMTHAGAVNHLRGGLTISRKPFDWAGVFVEDGDYWSNLLPPDADVGGFRRAGKNLPVYEKPEGVTAYIIGEEGEVILAISKGKMAIVPLVNYEGPGKDYAKKAIEERMFALFEAVMVHGGAAIQLVPKAEDYFRECFRGKKGTVRVQPIQDDVLIGIYEPAGIVAWATPYTVIRVDEGVLSLCRAGLVIFDDRIRFCREIPV